MAARSQPITWRIPSRRPRSCSCRPSGLVIVDGGNRCDCGLFAGDTLTQAKASRTIYQPLCDGRIYLRNPALGVARPWRPPPSFCEITSGAAKRSSPSATRCSESRIAKPELSSRGVRPVSLHKEAVPLAARIDSAICRRNRSPPTISGSTWVAPKKPVWRPGQWYPADGNPGVWVSILQPDLIDSAILQKLQNDRK